ncbi:MAG: hypothetical protein R3E42_13830 [Burkholderiaceae bacterium]
MVFPHDRGAGGLHRHSRRGQRPLVVRPAAHPVPVVPRFTLGTAAPALAQPGLFRKARKASAFAGLAMGLAALFSAVALPLVASWFWRPAPPAASPPGGGTGGLASQFRGALE